MAGQGQKTEQPTERRKEKARRDGQFPSSRQAVASVQFVVFAWLMARSAPEGLAELQGLMRDFLSSAFEVDLNDRALLRFGWEAGGRLGMGLAKAGLTLVVAAVVTQLAVTRLGLATSKLAPDLSRLDPSKRLGQLPQQNLEQFGQSLLLIPAFLALAAWIAAQQLSGMVTMPRSSLASGIAQVGESLNDLVFRAALCFLLVGILDWWRQSQRFHQELMMTKQEIRDEMKEVDGDPAVKARIRRMQREFGRRRMMKEVETATAVIVNPTHYAVALRYLPQEMPAPMVVGKGKDYLALRIRERAAKARVPIVENPPLARSLYGSCEPGQSIPPALYRAVAEVLAYIYRMNGGNPAPSR